MKSAKSRHVMLRGIKRRTPWMPGRPRRYARRKGLAQKGRERLPRSMDPNLHGGRREAERVSDFLRRSLLDVAQDQHDSVAVRQLIDGGPDGGPRFLALEQGIGWCRPVRELFDMVSVLQERGEQGLDRLLGLSPAGPQLHERRVHHDAVQPG